MRNIKDSLVYNRSELEHNHDATYLGINDKAADADKLDGYDSSVLDTPDTVVVRDINGKINVNQVQLSGGIGTQGTLSWNNDEETLDLIQNGATLQLGQETQIHCRNNTAFTIPNGTVVMATGTLGGSGRITIAPMDGTNPANAKFLMGITTEDIVSGDDGKVTHFGKIRQLNTTAWNDGDVLWVSDTVAGALTKIKPSYGELAMPVAFVIHAAINGTLFVRVSDLDYNAFAQYVHSHVINDITGLQTALDGKASTTHNHNGTYEPIISKSLGYAKWNGTSWVFTDETYSLSTHTHNYLPLTGGDITGNLSVSGDLTVGDTVNPTGIKAYIKSGSSGRTWEPNQNLDLVIETPSIAGIHLIGGNANEQRIYFSDTDQQAIGSIIYNHADNSLRAVVNGYIGYSINNLGQITSAPTYNNVSSQPSNVYIDSTGKLYRSTAVSSVSYKTTENLYYRATCAFGSNGFYQYPTTSGIGAAGSTAAISRTEATTGNTKSSLIPKFHLTTTTTANSIGSYSSSSSTYPSLIEHHPKTKFALHITFGGSNSNAATNYIGFFGMNQTANTVDGIFGGTNNNFQHKLPNAIGVGWRTTDTNLQIIYLNTSNIITFIDLGENFKAPPQRNSEYYMYELIISRNSTSKNIFDITVTDINTGNTSTNSITVQPTGLEGSGLIMAIKNIGGSTVALKVALGNISVYKWY